MRASIFGTMGLDGHMTRRVLAFAMGATASSMAYAQAAPPPAPASSAANGDIVVTANRREERLQRVPISVAAVSSRQLVDANITRPEELQKLVPGFTAIPNAGSATTSFNIRGVGQSDFSEHQEQPVAIYQDGIYVATSASGGFPIFDIRQVEILRGPQGTLFGRNSTGGLVQFTSNAPGEGLHGGLTIGGGARDLRRIEGFLNAGNDKVAARIAGYHLSQTGYITNLSGPNLLSQNITALRGQLKFTPDSDTTILARVEGWNSSGTTNGGKNQPSYFGPDGYARPLPANLDAYGTGPGKDLYGMRDGPNPLVQSVNDPGRISKQIRSGALYLIKQIGDVKLLSTTGYIYSNIHYREDSDGTPLYTAIYHDSARTKEFTQEFRVEGQSDKFRWTAGLYYFNITGVYDAAYNFPTLCDPTNNQFCSFGTGLPLDGINGKGAGTQVNYALRTRSYAGFAQGEYDLSRQLTFVLGGRYSFDNQKYSYLFNCVETLTGACGAIFAVGHNPGTVSGLGTIQLTQKNDDWSGKAGLNFKASENILLYANASKGLKGAGFSAPIDGQLPLNQIGFRPEKLYAYEVGIKSSVLDKRLTANLGAFVYNYRDFQTFQFSGVSSSVLNRDATSHGGELELVARPFAGISANLGAAYNDLWVKSINTPSGPQRQRAINAPKWEVNWGIRKTFDLSRDTQLTLGYSGRYTSSRYFNIVNLDTTLTPGFTLHDLNATITRGNFKIDAFVTNFTNVVYANVRFDSTGTGFYLSHIGEPRSYGVSGGYSF